MTRTLTKSRRASVGKTLASSFFWESIWLWSVATLHGFVQAG